MPSEYYCDADRFAITVNQMMERLVKDVDGKTMPVVRKSCNLAKRDVSERAKRYGWTKKGDGEKDKSYAEGFKCSFKKKKLIAYGEVGNSVKPGLVHLLEKGHAKMGGGRTNAYPHMAPAAEVAFDYFWDEMQREVGEAL